MYQKHFVFDQEAATIIDALQYNIILSGKKNVMD